MRPPRPTSRAILSSSHAAKPEAPDHMTFLKKAAPFSSQNPRANSPSLGRITEGYSSRKSAWLLEANSWKNCSCVSVLMHAIFSSRSAFWRGLRSAATTRLAPSSAMSSTLQPPLVSMRMVSLPVKFSSSQSTRGSSQLTL